METQADSCFSRPTSVCKRIVRGAALVSCKVTLPLQQRDGLGVEEASLHQPVALFRLETLLSFSSVLRMVPRPWARLTPGRGTSKRMHGSVGKCPSSEGAAADLQLLCLGEFQEAFSFPRQSSPGTAQLSVLPFMQSVLQ